MNRILTAGVLSLTLMACTSEREAPAALKTGTWRAVIVMQGQELPFNFEVSRDASGGYDLHLINADERILLDEVNISGDSVEAQLHIFDASIRARIDGDSLRGTFIKHYEEDYAVPFRSAFAQTHRFEKGSSGEVPDFSGTYAVTFVHESDTTLAVAVFAQVADSVTGTFLTPTGDYRFLQGNVADGRLQLSAFDGNHAYLFRATQRDDDTLDGIFYSGETWVEAWVAVRDEQATLPEATSLTYLKEGHDRIDFSFPDADGNPVSLSDKKFQNKVVILQLGGSWCPNCMDETKFLAGWYDENKHRGVEILGLAYERKPEFDYASARVKKMVDKLDVGYDFLIAGTNDKEQAARTLPMLNAVVAFPTTIFIGKDGTVRKIHTGFSGPGTGKYYDQFIESFNTTVNELLNEKVTALNKAR